MKLWFILLAALVLVAVAGAVLWRLADHDLERRAHEGFDFQSSGQTISGSLWLPEHDPIAAIALVHGDGPQDRTSAGGYAPVINALLDRRIAVASWDKPGVGVSDGNWLHQSMADRTAEVQAALQRLNQRFDGVSVGALGFSQAGWVLPSLTRDDADFLVLVGAAVSWQDQGAYYTRVRLAMDGASAEEIEGAIAGQDAEDQRVFGPNASVDAVPDGMSTDRWRFIRQNRDADAREALAGLDLPLLALWGEKDLNVDAARNAAIYRDILSEREAPTQIVIWPDATHGLLKASAYNWQLTGDWSAFGVIRFLAEGRYAYAPGALDRIADWVAQTGDSDS
ncbi:alpha/beta hydrolase [uncultured Roseobacter sp.]|uniref:alpha/beta hydrolase n=1 Tax=uncultured Roseobacter sp. TaxID=114847 RepID=UPI0026085E14|nr:alpha/beta hydrolase [uncultured Roseobacter sp.]